jgi:hypothetical protein
LPKFGGWHLCFDPHPDPGVPGRGTQLVEKLEYDDQDRLRKITRDAYPDVANQTNHTADQVTIVAYQNLCVPDQNLYLGYPWGRVASITRGDGSPDESTWTLSRYPQLEGLPVGLEAPREGRPDPTFVWNVPSDDVNQLRAPRSRLVGQR